MKHGLLIFITLLGLSLTSQAGTALETASAGYRVVPREYRLDGVVEAVNRSTVSAQTRGQVEQILFDVDDYVEKGQLIVKLKDTEQRAQLAKAEASLKEANANYQKARDDYDRIKGVFDKGLISQSEMDRASTTLAASKAQRDAARAQLEQSREQFEYTRVKAPYSGIVTDRYVEVGEIANPGQKLMSGISLDQLRVLVDVPQSLIPAIRKIGKARVQLPGNGYIPATRLIIFPYAQHGSNTFRVRLDLPEGTKDLFPGMFVKTSFTVGEHQQLLIPLPAVVYRSEVTGTYVVAPDGHIALRHIRLGRKTDDGMVVVLAGLDEGEQVALDPIQAGVLLKQQQAGRKQP